MEASESEENSSEITEETSRCEVEQRSKERSREEKVEDGKDSEIQISLKAFVRSSESEDVGEGGQAGICAADPQSEAV